MPIGYHGRASSIVVSGASVPRPWCDSHSRVIASLAAAHPVGIISKLLSVSLAWRKGDYICIIDISCRGQVKGDDGPLFRPSEKLDFELELVHDPNSALLLNAVYFINEHRISIATATRTHSNTRICATSLRRHRSCAVSLPHLGVARS